LFLKSNKTIKCLKKILTIILSLFITTVANADVASQALNKVSEKISEYTIGLIPGEGITELSLKYKDSDDDQLNFSILGVRDILRTDDSNLFTQFSFKNKEVNSDGRVHGNLGFGYRKLNDDQSIMLGANTFLDGDLNKGHKRLGLGLEAKGSMLDLSLNNYQKITNMKTIDGTDEQILSGWDYNLTTQIPYTPWAKFNFQGYKWENEKTSQDTKGNQYSSELNINSSLQLNLSLDDSALTGVEDVYKAELVFIHPPRENVKTMKDGFSDIAFEKENMEVKLAEKVRRNNDLAIEIQGQVIVTSK